ncbi:MAG: Rrf2 family transcriptional regulator [Flavobacteriaceae bacterium]|nr:Rrf2 family transcriptional regulator [Flavobacteriaceae bacterium]
MFSNSVKYAINAVLYLAINSKGSEKILARDISETISVPKAYIAKLLQDLVRHNIISSARGPKGGFYLTEANRKIPIIRIVELIDGEEIFKSCVLGLSQCNDAKPCPLHEKISPYRWSLLTALEYNTIQDFADEIIQSKSYLAQ